MTTVALNPHTLTCSDPNGHRAGVIGCAPSIPNCQGIPTRATMIDVVPLPAPAEAEPGVYSVIRTVRERLARVADVTGETRHGDSNPYGRPDARTFHTWEYVAGGHLVHVVTYESRGPLDRDARHYAALFVRGRLVDDAGALDMARGPVALAAEIAWRTARYLSDTPAADLVDDVTTEAPAPDAYRPAGAPLVVGMPADWDGEPATWLTTAQVAKLIRAALKIYFPGVKFSVRSDSYAGGSSIRVAWTDGPTSDLVDQVTSQYAGAGFNSMEDYKTHRGDVIVIAADGTRTAVRLGVDYVQTSRTESPELLDAQRPAAATMAGRELSADPTADQFPQGLGDTLGVWPIGGDGRELLRFLARTRTPDMRGSRDQRPACGVPGRDGRRCELAAGHAWPLMHRDGNRNTFIAPAATVDQVAPAPAEAPATSGRGFFDQGGRWVPQADAPATVDQVDAPAEAPAGFVVVHAAHHNGPAVPSCGVSLPLPDDHGIMRAPADLQAGTTQGGPHVPFIDLVTCTGCRGALTSGVTRPRCTRAVPAPDAWGGIGPCNKPADQVGTYRHGGFTDEWCLEHADADPRFGMLTWAPLPPATIAAPLAPEHPMPVEPAPAPPITAPAVHRFATTGEAYNASQTRDDIRDGDVLIVESERVAGFLLQAWPTTVTAEAGEFHTPNGDPAEVDGGRYAVSVAEARRIAATWDGGDQGDGGTPAPAGPVDGGDDAGAEPTAEEIDAVRADVAAYRARIAGDQATPITCAITPQAWVTAHVDQDDAPVSVSFDCPAHGAVSVPVDIDGPDARRIRQEHQECTAGDPFGMRASEQRDTPAARFAAHLVASGWTPEEAANATAAPAPADVWTLRVLPPGAKSSDVHAWRAGETFTDRDAAMLAAVRLSASWHAHGIEVRGGAGYASDIVASWHVGVNVWQQWGRYGVDYGPGAGWVDRAQAAYAAEVAAIVAGAADRTDLHSWQLIIFEASTGRARHTGESFDIPLTAGRAAGRINDRPFNYTARAYLVRVHAAATAVYRDVDLEPAVIPHDAAPAEAVQFDAPATVDQVDTAAPAPADVQGGDVWRGGPQGWFACTDCGGRKLDPNGSAQNGDGSRTLCRDCNRERIARAWDGRPAGVYGVAVNGEYAGAVRHTPAGPHAFTVAGADSTHCAVTGCGRLESSPIHADATDDAPAEAPADVRPAELEAPRVDVPTGPVAVADLVEGDRVHVIGIDQVGSTTHGHGYVQGAPAEVIVKGRTPSGRASKDPKKSRPGLLVALAENPNGWNGWRMTIITLPDAVAERVTDAAHQFRPAASDNPYLVKGRCSCGGWDSGAGEVRYASARAAWERHVTPPVPARAVVQRHTPEMLARAEALGEQAYGDGCPSAPGACPEVADMVRGWEVGAGAAEVFRAFSRGYSRAADRAAEDALRAFDAAQARAAESLAIAERNAEAAPVAELNAAQAESTAREVAARTAEADSARAALDAPAVDTPAQADADALVGAGEDGDQGDAPDVYTLPLEAYAPVLKSDQGGNLVITHDHEDGTVLHGSRRGDGVWEIIRTRGWEARRGRLFIRNSRDRFARLHTIDETAEALRAAGWTVAVVVDDVWRPAAIREEARADRASARAGWLSDRAWKQYAESNARREASRKIGDMMPFGEPIKIGHHSEAAHRRAFERIEAHTRASIAAWDYALHLAARAAGSISNEAAKHDPRAIMRRIERLEADRRQWERSLADAVAHNASGQARRSMLEKEMIAEDIAYQRAKLGDMAATGAFMAWAPEHFQKDDWANVGGRWCQVAKVNPKTLSVRARFEWQTPDQTERVTWDAIHGRRRDGLQWDRPDSTPWPVEQARRVAKWARLVRLLDVPCDRTDTSGERQRRHTVYARRIVLGLPRDASAQEVAAYGEPDTVEGKRARALACLAAWDRLEAGESFDQVAADTAPLADTAPAWTMPAGEPVDVRPRDLVPGDIVVGVYDRMWGAGDRLLRSIVGPVTAPTTEQNRHESGDWATITVDGVAHEMKTWRQLSAHLVGARPAPSGE